MKRQFIIVALLMLFGNAFAQPDPKEAENIFRSDKTTAQHDFSRIDNYVLGLKTKKRISEDELVALITKESKTKAEKARAIFIWIAANIAYDTSYKIRSKEDALKHGKGVCQAYSGLYEDFCGKVGLEVVTVSGDSKQYYYKKPSDLDKGGHAWNIVTVDDGRRIIVDATWGAGHVNNKVFTRKLSTYWFDPSPEIYIFTHFPKEDQFQMLEKPVSRDDFLRFPPLSPNLMLWGLDANALLTYYSKNETAFFPDQFTIDVTWTIDMMPLSNRLQRGKQYRFEFTLPQNEEVVVVANGKDFHRFQKEGDKNTLIFTPDKKGQAVVAVKHADNKFGGVFKYTVD